MNGRKRTAAALIAMLLFCALPSGALAADALIPGGKAVGIELDAGGVIIAGFSTVDAEDGARSPAEEAGLKAGDVIVSVGGHDTKSAKELLSVLSGLDGETVVVEALREGETLSFRLTPARSREGMWQLGLWLRDGVTGIGTVTYYDPVSGRFGALGHGVNSAEDGKLLSFCGGSVTDAVIIDVVRGGPGAPGELCGQPDRARVIGSIDRNNGCGVFGTAEMPVGAKAIPVAAEEEVRLGPATILATVNEGGVEAYDVEISRIYRQPTEHRFLMLTVTDRRLLDETGGIVQGMSGSPIIQDGKLVGAVTHVLLSDATRGYGISIREMMDAAS